jgi:hypothetical protein
MLTLRTRFILMGLFVLASVGFGATGEYQQTRDGKTTVWNGSPKLGETASWAGARDKEGYANGFGTITWYTDQGTVYAMYYGNMLHGKLDGPVNAHSKGKTAHAYFADGGRITPWGRGPAPSHPEANWPLRAQPVEEPKTEENEPQAEVTSETKAKKPKPEEREGEVATETKPKKPKSESEKIRPIEHVAKKTEERERPPRETATVKKSQQSEIRTTAERPPEETPKPPPAIAEMHTVPSPEPTQSASSVFEPPKIAESQETPMPVETPQVPIPEPSVEQKAETVEPPATAESTAKSGTDGSLSALTGPPSSLRSGSIPESSAPSKSTTKSKSTSSGTRGVAQLSEDEAIGLADIEARTKGYDLNEYQRPKADYSAVKDKWSLFYNLKDLKAAGGDLQPFSVTVEDKTKKVEIRRNY